MNLVTLPRDAYEVVIEVFKDKVKAEIFVNAIETIMQKTIEKADQEIVEKKETIKASLYNELRNELATKEFVKAEVTQAKDELRKEIYKVKEELKREIAEVREELKQEINEVREELKQEINEIRSELNEVKIEIENIKGEIGKNNLLLKVLIGISIFGLTLINPTFVEIIKAIFK